MHIRVQEKETPWKETENDWFHAYRGCIFKVVGIYSGTERLYAVDARSLPLSGPTMEFAEGPLLIPSRFCDLVPD